MSQSLSELEVAALFDVLSHYDTYAEIRDFRDPESLLHYGPPFSSEHEVPSTTPALQSLVARFLLNLPGLKDFPREFWEVQCHDIIENFEKAELSESYDKGSIGTRKTIATAIAALIEYPVRGTHGGFTMVEDPNQEYDLTSAEDLSRAFRDFLHQAIYGNIIDDIRQKAAETDLIEDHPPLNQALHEFMLVNIASLMHYTLVLTPKGQYLVKLMDNINRLIPYVLVRQTLKIGNVATMINGLVKIGLVKMSVASITNWIGLTQTEDEGMNLMQQIISTVLNWDIRDLESRASKVEKDKHGLSKEQIQVIKDYITKPKEVHEKIRRQSQEEYISIVTAIFDDAASSAGSGSGASTPASTSTYWTAASKTPTSPHSSKLLQNLEDETVHSAALEYLAVQLSIRDRREIIRVLCRSVPDHFTTATRSGVAAYEPVIRELHKAVDLSDTVYDFEIFLKDLLKLAKVQTTSPSSSWWGESKDANTGTKNGNVPSVGDFVQLLRKHQYSLHKFLHQVCKNGPELAGWFCDWGKATATQFKRDTPHEPTTGAQTGAGDLTEPLKDLFDGLPEDKQQEIKEALAVHMRYLDDIHAASNQRLAAVIHSSPSKNPAIAKIVSGTVSRPGSRPGSRPTSRAASRNTSPNSAIGTSRAHSPPKSSNLKPVTNPTPAAVAVDPTKPPSFPRKDGPAPSISSDPGPGAFLARWQDLLESTPITFLTPRGRVQRATSKDVIHNSATDVDGQQTAEFPHGKSGAEKVTQSQSSGKKVKKPDLRIVIECLGKSYRKLLARRSLYW